MPSQLHHSYSAYYTFCKADSGIYQEGYGVYYSAHSGHCYVFDNLIQVIAGCRSE